MKSNHVDQALVKVLESHHPKVQALVQAPVQVPRRLVLSYWKIKITTAAAAVAAAAAAVALVAAAAAALAEAAAAAAALAAAAAAVPQVAQVPARKTIFIAGNYNQT